MIGLPLTVDVAHEWALTGSQAIYEQLQYSPLFAQGSESHLVVSIDVPAQLVINPPAAPYVMNQAQRDAMERAFWRSVEVVNDGYE
jgi:hypothetical protein